MKQPMRMTMKNVCGNCRTLVFEEYENVCSLGYPNTFIVTEQAGLMKIGYYQPGKPCPKPTTKAELILAEEIYRVDMEPRLFEHHEGQRQAVLP